MKFINLPVPPKPTKIKIYKRSNSNSSNSSPIKNISKLATHEKERFRKLANQRAGMGNIMNGLGGHGHGHSMPNLLPIKSDYIAQYNPPGPLFQQVQPPNQYPQQHHMQPLLVTQPNHNVPGSLPRGHCIVQPLAHQVKKRRHNPSNLPPSDQCNIHNHSKNLDCLPSNFLTDNSIISKILRFENSAKGKQGAFRDKHLMSGEMTERFDLSKGLNQIFCQFSGLRYKINDNTYMTYGLPQEEITIV